MSAFLLSTEERIKQAASKVFLEKGYAGTTTRDIAQEANLNIALLNYYFRSKEKLFVHVFKDMLQLLFEGVNDIMNRSISLEEKINVLIDHKFAAYLKNPDLPMFIHNELHHELEQVLNTLTTTKLLHQSILEKQLKEAIKAGEIRPITIQHLLLLVISNVQFIFLSRILSKQFWNLKEEAFNEFAADHKVLVKEMITAFLFLKDTNQKNLFKI